MGIFKFSDKLQQLRKKERKYGGEIRQYISFLEDFILQTNLENYVVSNDWVFSDIEEYKELMICLAQLLSDMVQISDIKANEIENNFSFSFKINGESKTFMMKEGEEIFEFFRPEFLDNLNSILSSVGLTKEFKMVESLSAFEDNPIFILTSQDSHY